MTSQPLARAYGTLPGALERAEPAPTRRRAATLVGATIFAGAAALALFARDARPASASSSLVAQEAREMCAALAENRCETSASCQWVTKKSACEWANGDDDDDDDAAGDDLRAGSKAHAREGSSEAKGDADGTHNGTHNYSVFHLHNGTAHHVHNGTVHHMHNGTVHPNATSTKTQRKKGAHSVIELAIWTEGYAARNNSWYPWEHIVEPHKATHVRVIAPDHHLEYRWTVEALCVDGDDCEGADKGGVSADAKGLNGFQYLNQTGSPELVAVFRAAGTQYVLNVEGVDTSGVNESVTDAVRGVPLICKYVRREVRDLIRDDREAFFEALEIAHRVPLGEGRAKYGEKYMDAIGLTRKHLARMTLDRCTPWHNGKVFFTAHAAFSLEMEQSLQAIDRTIALPFWDHTIDALYFGHDWPSSEIWSEEWFGASSPNSSGSHVITTGRWAYTPIRTNKSAAERNSYGRITDHMNADPVQFLTRGARNVCGVRSKKRLPGCMELHKVMGSKNLEQLDHNVEYNFHGYIHMLLGGAWDCARSLDYTDMIDELGLDSLAGYVEDIAMNLNVLWRYFFLAGYLKFPEGCDDGDSFDHCRGTCPLLDYRIDDLTDEQVYNVLYTGDILSSMTDYMIKTDNATGKYVVDGLDYNGSVTFYRWLLPVLCGPGKMAAFATPLAATNDPVFWVSHNSYERIWSWMRVRPDRRKRWGDSWSVDRNETCVGHGYHDTVPWRNFIGEGSTEDYTNQQLLEFFDPRNPRLPHVYDNFEWDHCDWDPDLVPTLSPTFRHPPTE